ncbi:MAG: molybdopterin-dependent oxidoreductase [Gemmatimonadetes bacterium]|nr:molybdopterin-dependent oxidoreductase [Gemmatimonadota bacterium]
MAEDRAPRPEGAEDEVQHAGDVSRRRFLGASVTGAAALGLGSLAEAGEALAAPRPDAEYTLDQPENQIYSACLQCNTGCGIKVKVQDGVAVKIDGNPYNPFTVLPSLPFATPVDRAARVDAPLCPKGQAGVQTLYDPYRIRKVLKRAGERGANRWITVPFDEAIREIVEGGKLFAHVPGEEERVVTGLREVRALTEPAVFRALAEDAKAVAKKKMSTAEFKAKHARYLDALIDPDHPDLGPKNNQFVYMWGRKKDGRSHFARRFLKTFGSVNGHGHTTVCQGSLYFTGKAMSDQWVVEEKDGKVEGKFDGGQKFYFQIDTEQAEFVLFVGANLLEANYGPTNRAPRVSERIADGKLKIAVVDPRFSKLASKAWRWYPIRPGTDGALAMGLARWIFENDRLDKRYLACANRGAAAQRSEPSWSNATWLVKIDGDGRPGAFVRKDELLKAARTSGQRIRTGVAGDPTQAVLVVKQGDRFVFFDPNGAKTPAQGDLFVDLKVGDLRLKSALQIYRENCFERTLGEWAEICGIPEAEIALLARELTSHGKRAGVEVHRGVSQHPNGFYNVFAFFTVNMLLGNYGWAGGSVKASTYSVDGSKEGQPYPLAATEKGLPTPFGIDVIRHGKYEETTLFAGYPARRNWWPLATDVYQEIIPSIGDDYPYPIKVLLSYMAAPTYSLPGGHTNIQILRDLQKVPLHIACDITVGVTSMYADYIFPDLSYLERWEFQGSHPNMPAKVQPVRQPTADFGNDRVAVYGERMPLSFEALLLALAERLGLSGFGPDGLGPGQALTRAEDLYLKMVANVAMEGTPVRDAEESETAIFRQARRHLNPEVFDEERWKRAVAPALWPKVVTVLNRGGRFQDYDKVYDGDLQANPYKGLLALYSEKIAGYKNSFTGKQYPGYPTYVPVATALGPIPSDFEEGYPLVLITNRIISMTKSRTIGNYWLLALTPGNDVEIHPRDAARFALRAGDRVRVVSATNPEGVWELGPGWTKPMEGTVRLSETVMPGTVTVTLGHGLWAGGASDVTIDGKRIEADPRRQGGIHANAAMWLDPYLKNTCMLDPLGGSVAFYDTRVRLERVG